MFGLGIRWGCSELSACCGHTADVGNEKLLALPLLTSNLRADWSVVTQQLQARSPTQREMEENHEQTT
jgi:hypothetical protein